MFCWIESVFMTIGELGVFVGVGMGLMFGLVYLIQTLNNIGLFRLPRSIGMWLYYAFVAAMCGFGIYIIGNGLYLVTISNHAFLCPIAKR